MSDNTSSAAPESNPGTTGILSPIAWRGDALWLLEQTLLPKEEKWIEYHRPEDVADAIRRLAVRGAPAIGVAAAYGLVLGMSRVEEADSLESRFEEVYALLAATRPTAVNLVWALDLGRTVFDQFRGEGPKGVYRALLGWAQEVHRRDIETNLKIGENGAGVFASNDRVLTHCNAGSLATGGYGTAVGVITSAFQAGKVSQVWVDETRPLLQGARLTAWELDKLQIPYRLVTDNSVGALMTRGLVDRVVVGADRIAANGDAANKIGTYVVAVLAARHKVPFYVAAPLSTIDRGTLSGDLIPIEVRASEEVTEVFGIRVAPEATEAHNFAFDVTPNDLITGIITEMGVLEAPYGESIRRAFAEAEAKSKD